MADQITLVTDDYSGPSVPQSFEQELRNYDPTLLVRWNSRKMRFVIEQCVQHLAPTAEHNHLCARIYVLLVQDSEGGMMSLGSGVMDMLRARDVTKQGYGPNDLNRWIGDRNAEEEAVKQEISRKQRDAVTHCSKLSRRQLLNAFNQLSNMGTPNR